MGKNIRKFLSSMIKRWSDSAVKDIGRYLPRLSLNRSTTLSLICFLFALVCILFSFQPAEAINKLKYWSFEEAGYYDPLAGWTTNYPVIPTTTLNQANRVSEAGQHGSWVYISSFGSVANNRVVTFTLSQTFTPTVNVNVRARGYYKRFISVDATTEGYIKLDLITPTTTVPVFYAEGTGTDVTWQGGVWTSTAVTIEANQTSSMTVEVYGTDIDNGEYAGGRVDAIELNVSPSGLTTVSVSSYSVSLQWNTSVPEIGAWAVSKYWLYRADSSGGPYTHISTITAPTVTYTDYGRSANTPYYYVVVDVDTGSVVSPYSIEITTTTNPPIDNDPPTGVGFDFLMVDSATVVSSSGTATDLGSGLASAPYTISRSSENGSWYPALDVGWVSSHTWTNLVPNTTYQFRIQARDNIGNISVWSSTTTKVTWCAPPNNVDWGTNWISSMTVSWSGTTDSNPANTKYIAQVSTDFAGGTIYETAGIKSDNSRIVTGLSANTTYYSRVIVLNWQNIASTSAVTSTKSTLCSPPDNPYWSTTVTTTTLQISWGSGETPANPSNTIYRAEVSLNSNFSPIAGYSQAIKSDGNATIINLSTNTVYYGRVIAQNWEMTGSSSTIGASTSTLAALPLKPAQPFTEVNYSSITTTWDANTNPSGTYYYPERADNESFTVGNFSPGWMNTGTAQIFTGLATGTTYWFRVKARNQQNISTEWTILGNTTTLTLAVNQPPYAPSSLGQSIGPGAWTNNQTPQISFTQDDPEGNAMKFTVQFSTYNNFSYIYHEGVSASFIAPGPTNYIPAIPLPEATSWYWRVRSSDTASGYTSEWSTYNPAGFAFGIDVSPPTNVGAQWPADWVYNVKISTQLYALTAQDAGSGVGGYEFRYSSHPGLAPWTFEDSVYGEYYQDVTLLAGVTYWWQVRAVDNLFNESNWYANPAVVGSTRAFVTLPVPGIPGTPTFTNIFTTSMTVQWTTATNADTYNLNRSTDNTYWNPSWVISGISGLSQNVTGLTEGTTYYFKVSATNTSGTGIDSGVGTTRTRPAAPTWVAEPFNVWYTSLTLTWNAVTGADTYKLYHHLQGGSYVFLATTNTAYTHIGLTDGSTHYYRVAGYNSSGEGEWSIEKSTITNITPVPPNTPPQITNISAGQGASTTSVAITYDFADGQQNSGTITINYWNGSWIEATSFGPGSARGVNISTGTLKSATWYAQIDFTGQEGTNNTYLQVLANDLNGGTTAVYTPWFSLDTLAPRNVTPANPSNEQVNVSTTPALSATSGIDANTINYHFQIDTNTIPSIGSGQFQESAWISSSWSPSPLSTSTRYYWRVQAKDSKGNLTAWSSTFSFVTVPQGGPATGTYDFANNPGANKWAWYGLGGNGTPPANPTTAEAGTSFTTTDYSSAATSNDAWFTGTTGSNNTDPYQYYKFTISESLPTITQLVVSWEGKANIAGTGYLLIWSTAGAGSWVTLATPNLGVTDTTVSSTVVSNINNYLDAGGLLSICVHTNFNTASLSVDYVKVDVTAQLPTNNSPTTPNYAVITPSPTFNISNGYSETLSCKAKGSSDLESSSVAYRYKWYKNSQYLCELSSAGAFNSNQELAVSTQIAAAVNDTIYCLVDAYDGANYSAASYQSNISTGVAGAVNTVPQVTAISAAQLTAGPTVQIQYKVADAEQSNLTVSAEYKKGAGGWTGMSATSGDIGSGISTGTAVKTILWNAKTQLGEVEANDYYVKVTANDGSLSGSSETLNAFSIDTKPPQIKTTTYLLVDPVSGDTVLQLRSVWYETNPNTATFQAAINGTTYGSEQQGTISGVSIATATITNYPASGLNGASYIDKTRSIITDDFGNSTVWSENDIDDWYVRPLVPSSATIVAIYNSSMTIRIEPNTLENGTSIYFLIRSTSPEFAEERYVQTTSTLTANGVWRSTDAWGGTQVTITNLTPGGTYYFSIAALNPQAETVMDGTWDNSTHGSIPVNSTSTYSLSIGTATKGLANQSPQISGVTASQGASTTTITVNYDLSDADNSSAKITLYYEWSGTTYAVTGAWGNIGIGVPTGAGKSASFDAKQQTNLTGKDIAEGYTRVYVYADDLSGGTNGAYSGNVVFDAKDPAGAGIGFVSDPVSGQTSIVLTANWQDPASSTNNLTTPQFAYRKNGAAYTSLVNGALYSGTEFRITDNTVGTLDGNDYFDSVKSQAYDKYGNGPTDIEYATKKYVQPKTPNPPTFSNINSSSLTVTYAKASGEPDDLYYAFKATSTAGEKYVQANKTLGASAVWQSTGSWGGFSFIITGLTGETTYWFSVAASNPGNSGVTNSAYSASASTCTPAAINNPPQLSWLGTAGYESDGVNPDTGVVTTNFVYRVKYYDQDSDTPTAGYPRLKVFLDYSTWTYTMTPADNLQKWNTTYYYQLNLTKTSSQYKYQILAQDMGSPPQTADTGLISGPTIYTNNPIIFSNGATTVYYGVDGSSVNRIGSNVITLKSIFADNDQTIATNYSVTFKVSTAPATGPEYTIVNNKTHRAMADQTVYSDVRNFVNIERVGSTYTVTYAWDPSTSVPTGAYSLYFRVTDGIESVVDDYANNPAELFVTSKTIVITELTKGTQKTVPGKTVCQACHPHYNRNWPHRDSRVPEYDCLTCHSAHGSDVGKNVQLIRATITAQVSLTDTSLSTMTVVFLSTAGFSNMGTLPAGTTGFGLVSVDTVGVQGGFGPCQVCHIEAKVKNSPTAYSLVFATSGAIESIETHGASKNRRCGECHSHLPAPEITSVSPTYASTMAAITLTVEGKNFDMRISRNPATSVKLSTGISGGETVGWLEDATWKNATKLEAEITTNTLVNLSTGTYYVTVINPNGKTGTWYGFHLLSPDQFIPHISSFTPASGPVGTLVTVYGEKFYNSGNVSVKFGTNTASSQYWINSSTVQAVVSTTTSSGWYKITLTNSAGQSDDTADLAVASFNVTGGVVSGAKPEISSIWPNFGSAGATFIINGSSFGVKSGQAAVKIYGDRYEQYGTPGLIIVCDDDSEILRWTNNDIKVQIPSFKSGNILSVAKSTWTTPNTKVIVVSAEGSSSTVTADNFTLISLPPKVESISPVDAAQGVSNVPVVVKGKYFSPDATLYLRKPGEVFDISASNINLVNISTITGQFSFTVDQTTGDWRVIVRNPDLREPTEQLLFEVLSAPSITSVEPTWGSSATAKAVTIYGTGFRNPPEIRLSTSTDFVPAITVSSRNYESASVIRATFPALTEYPGYPLGWYQLKITNPIYYGSVILEQGYKYEPVSISTPPPSIASISPSEVYNNINTTITITGANFVSTPTVKVGAPVASAYDALSEIWNSATQMKAVIPAGLTPGTTDISVINFYGTPIASTATLSAALTIIKGAYTCNDCHNAPTITSSPQGHGDSHQKHYDTTYIPTQYGGTANNSDGTQYEFACGKCHKGTHLNDLNSGSTTINAHIVELVFDTTTLPINSLGANNFTWGSTTNTLQGPDGQYYAWNNITCGTNGNELYCHGKLGANTIGISSRPVWGSGDLTCTACHSTGTATSSGYSHGKHVSTYTFTCDFCHENIVSGNTVMLDSSKHVNGYANVELKTSTNIIGSSAKYRGQVSSAVITGGSYGSCSDIYCHSNATGTLASDFRTIQWGTTVDCGSCHNQSMTTGSHSKHVNSPWNIACSTCHPNVNLDRSKHVNYQINVTTGGYGNKEPYSYLGGYGSCSNLSSCHGSGTPQWGTTLGCADCHAGTVDLDDYNFNNGVTAKISTATVQWGNSKHKQTASLNCTSAQCHNTNVQHGVVTNPFRLADAYLVEVDSGCRQNGCHSIASFVTHSSVTTEGNNWVDNSGEPGSYKCIDCHDPHADSNTKGLHSRIARDSSDQYGKPSMVDLSTYSITATALAKATDYIKSGGGGSADYICQTCHQSNSYFTISIGSASQHNGGDNAASCVTSCHKHNQGFRASCSSCHGNESTGQIWPDGAGTTRSTDTAAAHNKHINIIAYRRSLSTGTLDGQKEICKYCHGPNPGGSAHNDGIPAEVGSLKYISGAADAWSAPASTSCSIAISTHVCYNSDCHAELATPNWYRTPAATLTCEECHGNPKTRATLAHTTHTATNGLMKYECTECHPKYNVGISTHLNGFVSMNFLIGSTQSVRTGTAFYDKDGNTSKSGSDATGNETTGNTDFSFAPYSTTVYGQCYNVYCHRPGGSENGSVVKWNEHWTSYAQYDTREEQCGACHGKPPTDEGSILTHQAHNGASGILGISTTNVSGSYQFGCGICHNQTNGQAGNPTYVNPATHARGIVGYGTGGSTQTAQVIFDTSFVGNATYTRDESAANSFSDNSRGFYQTKGKCENTYCHGVGLPASTRQGIDISTPSWSIALPNDNNDGEQSESCGSCHNIMDSDTPSKTTNTGSHGAHLNRIYKQMAPNNGSYKYDCTRCHSTVDNSNNSKCGINVKTDHINKANNVNFDSLNPGGNY